MLHSRITAPALIIVAAYLLAACSDPASKSKANPAGAAPNSSMTTANATPAAATNVSPVQARLADPLRPDRNRDAGRKPMAVLKFLGVAPGNKAMDLLTAGGYYAEVLAAAVGPSGTVYAQNPPALLRMRDGAYGMQLTARLANGRLPNVVRLDAPADNLAIEPRSLDVITLMLFTHDIYQLQGEAAVVGLLQTAAALLTDDGVIGLIDHVGNPGGPNSDLHRIDPAVVRTAITKAGLIIDAESNILANPNDDHTTLVFADSIRGTTDRFLFRVRKPA